MKVRVSEADDMLSAKRINGMLRDESSSSGKPALKRTLIYKKWKNYEPLQSSREK